MTELEQLIQDYYQDMAFISAQRRKWIEPPIGVVVEAGDFNEYPVEIKSSRKMPINFEE